MKIFNNKRILIISPEPWEHNFLSKHHYAIALANVNNQVFFLNPPSKRNSKSVTSYPNLFILDYKPVVRGLNKLPLFLSHVFWKYEVKRLEKLAENGFDIVWSFDPYRFQALKLFPASKYLYYSADWHENRKLENKVASHAQYIFSPSSIILQNIETSAPKIKVSHGVAEYFFDPGVPRKVLPGTNTIKVGYVGNLRIKSLDKELLLSIIHQNADIDFVLAGETMLLEQDSVWKEILGHANVYGVGTLANQDVQSFLQGCDLLLLVYNTVKYKKEASNSHKILEYLSSGKVILSTPMEEYKDDRDLLYMPDEYDRFQDFFKDAVCNLQRYNSPALMKKRIDFARLRSYNSILSQIDSILAVGNSQDSNSKSG